jgi:hypothetical protein
MLHSVFATGRISVEDWHLGDPGAPGDGVKQALLDQFGGSGSEFEVSEEDEGVLGIRFFSSEDARALLAQMEDFTATGKSGHGTWTFEVENVEVD